MNRLTVRIASVLCAVACGALWTGSALAAEVVTLIGSAEPDECFDDIGLPYPAGPPCDIFGGIPEKTNQTYMWSLTRAGNKLWGGTGANVFCTTSAAFLGGGNEDVNEINVCEFGSSDFNSGNPLIGSNLGDWRPAQIWEFDPANQSKIDRTPYLDANLLRTIGFRSGGSHNGVAFFAGGSFDNGIIMFAFDTDTGEYLGSRAYPQYRTIRKWKVINNVLYTGAGTPGANGEILRWTGNKANPFRFAVVGSVSGVPRELTGITDGNGFPRIVTSARGVFVSPPIRRAGLFRFHASRWTQLWAPADYEPDLLISTTYGGGAIQWFDGWVWWATMHVPGRSAFVHSDCLIPFVCSGEPDEGAEEAFFLDTLRLTTLWRARNIGTPAQEVQLVYGETDLMAYDPVAATWGLTPTGWVPQSGPMGYFPLFTAGINFYTWTMAVANGGPEGAPALFLGTLDLSLLFGDFANAGADLLVIEEAATPVVALKHANGGLGGLNIPNLGSYGIRTMEVSEDGNQLYLGTASMSNLQNFFGIIPGWQLIEWDFDPAP